MKERVALELKLENASYNVFKKICNVFIFCCTWLSECTYASNERQAATFREGVNLW